MGLLCRRSETDDRSYVFHPREHPNSEHLALPQRHVAGIDSSRTVPSLNLGFSVGMGWSAGPHGSPLKAARCPQQGC
jgi:hypothetical protein